MPCRAGTRPPVTPAWYPYGVDAQAVDGSSTTRPGSWLGTSGPRQGEHRMSTAAPAYLARDSTRGRMMLAGVTLGSGVAILDGSVVNVALRTIGQDLGASLAQLQWVVNGYLLALASLVLVGGALGDRLGRRRVYLVGVAWFMVASALCALAQTPTQLIALRVLQGVGAALLTPGALSLIQASFRPQDRAPAIGTWAGLSGVAAAVGPLARRVDRRPRELAVDLRDQRAAVPGVLVLTARSAPESRGATSKGRFDVLGAALTVLALGGATYALTAAAEASPAVVAAAWVVAAAVGGGVRRRRGRTASPLVPLGLFGSRVFSAANGMTLLVYGALGGVSLFTVLQLQAAGWGALAGRAVRTADHPGAAAAVVPDRGPVRADRAAHPDDRRPARVLGGRAAAPPRRRRATWARVLPGMIVFALGLALLVSPLTAAVLAAAPDRYAGAASGVNNAVARAGSLLAVAALPALVGLVGDDYLDPEAMTAGYRGAMLWCAVLLALGGVVSWFGLGREARP